MTHYMSRHAYPTRLITNGMHGHLSIGYVLARKALESQLGRSLSPETRIDKRAGNWRFREATAPKTQKVAA